MNLFNIDERILGCVDMETGEIIDEEQLAALDIEREQKIKNIAQWCVQLDYDIAAYKAQKKHFDELRAKAEKRQESLKAYLGAYLDGQKWSAEDKSVSVGFRKSKSLSVFNEDVIPDRYFNTKVEKKIDKVLITEEIKKGIEVEGCALVEKSNIQIK